MATLTLADNQWRESASQALFQSEIKFPASKSIIVGVESLLMNMIIRHILIARVIICVE